MSKNTRPGNRRGKKGIKNLAEVVVHIQELYLSENTAPVFKPTDLAAVYRSRMIQLLIKLESKVNTTTLKERNHYPHHTDANCLNMNQIEYFSKFLDFSINMRTKRISFLYS